MELTMGFECSERLDAEQETLERETEMEPFLRDAERRAYRIAVASVRDAGESLDIVQKALIRRVSRRATVPAFA
jgi:DNA-directed RNA polymerase specialized sigma24 family protein